MGTHPIFESDFDCLTVLSEKKMSWEVQFRKSEAELDLKLSSFQNLSTEHDSVQLEAEIETLLNKLNQVVKEQDQNPNVSLAVAHKLGRHRDVLADYDNQLRRTKGKHHQAKNRRDLLGSVRHDISQYHSQNQTKMSLLNTENDKLKNSSNLTDTATSIALSTQDSLRRQRSLYKNINRRMLELATKFPVINSLVNRISMRKKRDSFIMGGVVALCLILIIFYTLH